MYLAYSLLLTLGLIVLIPRFLFQALAHGKYLPGLRQRLGSLEPLTQSNRPTLWLHCVSVGETQAARPFVRELRKKFPNHQLVISTVTATGQKVAREVFEQDAAEIIYFPFDWSWCVRRSLAAIKPDVVLMMETELWPNFLRRCAADGIPVGVVNGRISKKSFRGYNSIKFFVSRILENLSIAVMQSQADAERICALGIDKEKVVVGGNLKFDVAPAPKTDALTEQLRERFNFSSNSPLILAASTHATEERSIIDSFKILKERNSTPIRLAIAPRHPERFSEVASLLEKSGLTWTRRSAAPQTTDKTVEAVLFDTIGELSAVYPLASIVFVGGSLIKKGGHNVLEPAAASTAIVTGAHTDNFEAIVQMLEENDAIIKLPPFEEPTEMDALCEVFESLLASPDRRAELGRNARKMLEVNKGAAARTVMLVSPLFQSGFKTIGPGAALASEATNS
jgi:3-deoxy-D-manno-octulosonic-acid transferase